MLVMLESEQVMLVMLESGAKRAPMVETKRNKAAIRLALSSAYSFGVALPMRLRGRRLGNYEIVESLGVGGMCSSG